MLRKVRIKSIPQARTGYQVNGSLANDVAAWGGADYNSYIGQPQMEVKKSLTRVPREEANLEAEGGETAVVNTGDIPAFYDIKGPRHSSGGVPLSLPDDSFIFSDTASMKITDPKVLKMFSVKPKKGGYTPAELSKKYEINDYRKILQDPESDSVDKKTAELMIKNAVMKLGALALAQEAKKGFPQSVPEIAKPYMQASGITEEDLMPELAKKKRELEQRMAQMQQSQQEMPQGAPEMMPNGAPVAMPQEMEQMPPEMMAQYGMEMGSFYPEFAYGGFTKFAPGGNINPYEKAKTTQGNITPTGQQNKFSDRKQKLEDYLAQWKDAVPGIEDMTEGQAQKAIYDWSLKNNPDSIRNMWSTYGLTAKGMKSKALKALSKDGSGQFTAEDLKNPELLAKLEDAYVDNYFGVRQLDPTKQPEPKKIPDSDLEIPEEKICTCPDGSSRVLKEGEECDCPDGEGIEEDVQEDVVQGSPDRKRSGPWLQDVIDVTGAASDYMGLKNYKPTLVSPSLVKPDFVNFDPSRAYGAIGEQGYLAAMAAGQFAGPQNVSGSTGQGYEALANVGAQYDDRNQAAGQQYEYNTNTIENQERGMKAGALKSYLDETAVGNQQFDDAKRKGKFNLRQGAKNLLTNMAQTDAMNQMYPNYQTDPTSGGFVNYTPTDKTLDTTANEDVLQYAYGLKGSGLDPELQKLLLEQRIGKSAKGGTTFRKGGYIYTVFPAVTM